MEKFRGGFSKTHDLLWEVDLIWLSMHSIKDGAKNFVGASTPYDMYVARKSNTPGHVTEIRDMHGQPNHVCVKDMKFIPNADFDEITSLLAKGNEERAIVEYDRSKYGIDKEWTSDIKTGEYKFKCVYTMPKNKPVSFYYSNTRKEELGHFGSPKVIFGADGVGDIICDYNGDYGLTQFAVGVVDDPKNLDSIRDALKSERFRKLMKSVCVGKQQYNRRVMTLFRKDFWKEFI